MESKLGYFLEIKKQPNSRLNFTGVSLEKFFEKSKSSISKIEINDGNIKAHLGDYFDIKKINSGSEKKNLIQQAINPSDPFLFLKGDLSRVDYIGANWKNGNISIVGDVGDYLGFSQLGGHIAVQGSVGLHMGCNMSNGFLKVNGDVGDYGACALPGQRQGVTGGTILVNGNVGDNFGDSMRRGLLIVFGNAGRFFLSRLVAGTAVISGETGEHVCYGMRRGTVLFLNPNVKIPNTFLKSNHNLESFLNLLCKDLKDYGYPLNRISGLDFSRYVGDISFDGMGEVFLVDD